MPKSPLILVRCEKCHKFFNLVDGSLVCAYNPPEWKIACTPCSTEWVYWIDLWRLFTEVHGGDKSKCGPDAWDEHLSTKNWYNSLLFYAAVGRLIELLDEAKAQGVNIFKWVPDPRAPPISAVSAEKTRVTRTTVEAIDKIERALPLKIRFAVLKRDKFRCHYCRKAGVELHVDHVVSRADGGSDDESNLVAACVDCNLGKGRESVSAPSNGST